MTAVPFATLSFLALLVGAYLLGSVPFGLVLSRAFAGVDVRTTGSGNIGATNVARSAGTKIGIATLVLDVAKAVVPALVARALWPGAGEGPVAAVGLAAFFGHLFPVWLRFKGGKGVATGLGVVLVLCPWAALLGLAAFAVAFAATRISSIGSLAGTLVCAAGTFALLGTRSAGSWAALVVAVAIVARHRSNIARLLRGAENKM
jgi:glycerol-3-phosphate acyltransferase PlsY